VEWPDQVARTVAETSAVAAGASALVAMGLLIAAAVMLVWRLRATRGGEHGGEAAGRQGEHGRFFELSNDILCVSDFEGSLRDTNPQAARTLGYSPHELCGLQLSDLIHPDDLGRACEVLGRLRRGEDARDVELRARRGDGSWCWLSSSSAACQDSGRIYTVARDVTEQRSESRDADRRRASVAHLWQRIWFGHLASEITHDLRQPLAIMINNVSAAARFMDRGPEFADETKAAIGRGVDQALHASDLLQRLSELSHAKTVQTGPVDVNDVVREARAMVEACATGDEPSIRLLLEDALPTVSGDATRLSLVVVNLLNNAREAAAAPPALAEGASAGPARRPVEVRTGVGEDGNVQIRVGDSGPGIPREVTESLFDPFVSTKTDALGLGLAICKRIVDTHRGVIRAENAPGGGAVFTVLLPASGGAGAE
jgi:PAS domain S-box-containing protein